MTDGTNLDELKRLVKKVSGKESEADSIADAICEIADAYSGSGGGEATIESVELYPDSKNVIKSGKVEMSDGTIISIDIVPITQFTVTSVAGSTAGTTSLTVDNSLAGGNTYRIVFDRNPSLPAIGEDVSTLTEWDGVSDIEANDGSSITVIEATSDGKVVKAGYTDVTIKY